MAIIQLPAACLAHITARLIASSWMSGHIRFRRAWKEESVMAIQKPFEKSNKILYLD